ncbi:non-homologous end-joining DNA ligase [Nocardioides sp.]|uniref:non-homologous end-joining DNA ligase n=1 Tax=Nocardioides sp. TaxID=35761 RepID=UPI00272091C1|nr:non-homologous end-joining DNA ligase [Nocardioides sp.]MDO9455951.1 non-homologous end-joining DNA ligase [Nocardioides sp.]
MRPMLATTGDHVPTGGEWAHEVKWDGMRILADSAGYGDRGRYRLTSRNDNDVTGAWPDVAEGLREVRGLRRRDLLVDGEVIALNAAGVPDFRTLQERMHVRRASSVQRLVTTVPVTFMVFDLLRLDGDDLTREPLATRRARLTEVLEGSPWQVPASYDDGAMLHEATIQQGLEGIVSKRLASPYRPGERSQHWLKFAHRFRSSYVVGGWRPQEGTTDRLAALLVGEVTPDGLMFRGRVGSGIAAKQSRALTEAVAGLARHDSPFADEVPRVDASGTFWLDPVLVVDLDSHGQGYPRLRQPSYRGIRTDLTPEDL